MKIYFYIVYHIEAIIKTHKYDTSNSQSSIFLISDALKTSEYLIHAEILQPDTVHN